MERLFDPIPLCQELVRIPSLSGQEGPLMARSRHTKDLFDEAW
jgi:hypothetical protein